MTAPTYQSSSFVQTAWNSSTTPKATAQITASSGDFLVAVGASAEGATGTANLSVSGGPTWTERQEVAVDAYCCAHVSTATAAGNLTPSFANGESTWFGGCVLLFTGSDGYGNSNKANNTTGAAQVAVTTTSDNEAIVAIFSDWNAGTLSTSYLSVNGNEPTLITSFRDAAQYSVAVLLWQNTGTAGSKTVGFSSPTSGIKWSLAAVSVKGTAGGGISGIATGGQGTQSVSSSGKQTAVGTGTSSQKSESASAVGSQTTVGTATSGQGSQTSASAGSGYLGATITASQGSQTISAIGTQSASGTITSSQGSQSASASGTQTAVGVVTAGQGSQTSAASAGGSIAGTIVAGQGGQTSSVVGSGYISATVTAGQGSQTSSIVGQQTSVGVGTSSQKSQSVTGTATVGAGVRLYWDDITGEDGYRVKWGTSSGNYTSSVDVAADVTFVDIWGLAANTLYYWIVVGLLSGVEQTPSSESTFNTYPTTGTSGQGSQTSSGAAKQTTIGIATSGQGSQRVDGIGSPGTSISGTITAGQGSQSVSSTGYLQLIGLVSAGQGSQSVTAASDGIVATASSGQGAQSIIAAGNIVIPGQVAVSQGSQSVGGSATVAIVGTCSSGQGSQYSYGTTIPLGELLGVVSRMLMGMGR